MGQTHATKCSKGKDCTKDDGPLFAPETDKDVLYVGMSRGSRGSRSSGGGGVVRQDIHRMSGRDIQRFVRAMRRMMDNGSYYQLASIHGWASNRRGGEWGYCEHRVERFVCWHRVYLAQWERALQAADRQLGNDGTIALPYWDWSSNRRIPQFMRDVPIVPANAFPANLRGGVGLPPNKRSRYFDRAGNMLLRHSNPSVRDRDVRDCYRLSFFPNFATKGRASPGGLRDIESIHDEVHVDCGGIMADLDLAAFSPLFWLHHCNIDRIFETYLFYEPDSSREMSRFEYGTTLRPWGAQTSRTFQAIGYRYQTLAHEYVPQSVRNKNRSQVNMIAMNPQQPIDRANQTVSAIGEHPEYHANPTRFPANTNVTIKVDVRKLTDNSFEVFVFGVPHGQNLDVNVNQPDRWASSRWHLATSGILFSRAVEACQNCQRNPYFEMHVPIQKGLQRIGRTRNQVKIKIFFKGNYGGTFTDQQMYQSGRLQGHSVSGPFFGDNTDLKMGDRTNDVAQLQRYLFKYGWYDGKIDGVFSNKTQLAMTRFQRFFGLKEDGVLGPKTKAFITMKFRIDDEPDNNGDRRRFSKKVVTYKVMSSPAYLDRNKLLREIDRAFDQWEGPTGVRFDRAQPNAPADIEIRWQSHFKFDIMYSHGVGGLLSRSDSKTIILNGQEKWMLLDGRIPRLGGFYVYNVMLHQVGKVIGLSNVGDPDDAMYPYYNATKSTLSEDDARAAHELYRKGNPVQRPHPRQNADPEVYREELPPCANDNYMKQRVRNDNYRRKARRASYNSQRPSYGPGPQPPPPGPSAYPANYQSKPVIAQPTYSQPIVEEYKQPEIIAYDQPNEVVSSGYGPAVVEEPCSSPIIEPPCGPCGQIESPISSPCGPAVIEPPCESTIIEPPCGPCGQILTEPVMDSAQDISYAMASDSRVPAMPTAEFSLECWKDEYGKEVCVKKFKSPQNTYQPSYSNAVIEPAPMPLPAPMPAPGYSQPNNVIIEEPIISVNPGYPGRGNNL